MRFLCFCLLLFCAVLQMQFAVQEQRIIGDPKELSGSAPIRSARLLTYYAQKKQMFDADIDGALALLQQALTVNSVYVPAWLSLAGLKNDSGEKAQAAAVLDYSVLLTKNLKRYRWEQTLVAYQLGKTEMLPGELRYIIGEIPGKNRNDALRLAFTLWKEPEDLISHLGRENISHLFIYAIRNKLPQKALSLWNSIESEGIEWQKKNVFSFLNMLLSKGYVTEAGKIWRKYFNTDSILYNGDFANDFIRTAFGWRNQKNRSFVQRFDKAGAIKPARSLEYRFKGWDNLNFRHLYQIVPVEGGRRYELLVEMRSRRLTTDQRLFWEIYGYKCKGLYAKTEMVAADQDWSKFSVKFDVPQECSAMVLRLRRNESKHIDSKLAGKIWVRNIAIQAVKSTVIIIEELSK